MMTGSGRGQAIRAILERSRAGEDCGDVALPIVSMALMTASAAATAKHRQARTGTRALPNTRLPPENEKCHSRNATRDAPPLSALAALELACHRACHPCHVSRRGLVRLGCSFLFTTCPNAIVPHSILDDAQLQRYSDT